MFDLVYSIQGTDMTIFGTEANPVIKVLLYLTSHPTVLVFIYLIIRITFTVYIHPY